MLNDKYIYVFVRQDLTIAQQLVHTNHAVFEMAKIYLGSSADENRFRKIPALIVIGMPDEKALYKVGFKLNDNGIANLMWGDDEHPELGNILAIATVPLDLETKKVLSKYLLYKEENNIRG